MAYKLETGYLFKADKPKKEAFEKALITLTSSNFKEGSLAPAEPILIISLTS